MNADEKAIRSIVRQLESLAGRIDVSRMMAGGADTYMQLQEDIFELQMKIQRAIGDTKQRRPRNSDVNDHLKNLRHVRWYSRRLGDAVAWNILLHDRQVIYALGKNARIPVPSDWSDGHRGAFQFARSLASREWGLPIIHDITSALRVGDVTFTKPARRPSKSVFRTVELKTSRVGEEVDEHGATVVRLNVTAISNEPFPSASAQTDVATDTEGDAPSESVVRRRPDRRIERQLARMDVATASKNAVMHQLTKIGDGHVFSLAIEDEQEPHWSELRRAIRAARRDGYAYLELGGFVGYSIFFNATGITSEDIRDERMIENVTGLMHDEIGDRNSLTVSHLPDDEDDSYSAKVLPFYLWEVPQRAIRDILRNRLMIVATYNSGWMEKLLRDAGLTVIPEQSGRDRRGFEVVASFQWEGQARVEYHSSVWEEMYVAVHEFRGPRAVVQRAVAPTTAPDIVDLDDFIPPDAAEARPSM